MTDREKRLVRHAEHCAHVDVVRHDKTKQRQFEQSMLSLDWKNEEGDLLDYGDCGRAASKLFRRLDAPFRKHLRNLRFWQALYRLRGYPELQTTLRAIRRHRVRQKIFSALKIRAKVYEMRFLRVAKILQIST